MSGSGRRLLAALALAHLAMAVPIGAAGAGGDWPLVGLDYRNLGNQEAERRIGPRNVARLKEEWRFEVPTELGLGVSAQPALADGVLYFADAGDTTAPEGGGTVYAVEAASGRLVWSRRIVGSSFATTPSVDGEFLYIAEARDIPAEFGGVLKDRTAILRPSRIFCLRRGDGRIVWSRILEPSRLPSTFSTPERIVPASKVAYAGDTTVVGGRVIVGVGSQDAGGGDTAARGSVVAFDRLTGRELWRVHTTSNQALKHPRFGGGAGAWSSPGVDTARGLLFIGTGQAFECPARFATCPPERFRPGSLASPLSDALLAIDYRAGRLTWHRQFTQDDVWGVNTGFRGEDADVATHPNLLSVRARLPGEAAAKPHDLVGVGDKGGKYYLLERDQAGRVGKILKTLVLDPGGSLGGFQSTPAFADGVLYLATHARIVDGTRQRTEFAALAGSVHSTKIVAVDLARLLEEDGDTITVGDRIGAGQAAFVRWIDVEKPRRGLLFGGFTFGPLTIANGVLYHPSSSGYFRALDAATGAELFRDVPLEFEVDLGPPVGRRTFAVPIFAGVTIGGGRIYVAVGTSFFGFPPNMPSTVVAYGLSGRGRPAEEQ